MVTLAAAASASAPAAVAPFEGLSEGSFSAGGSSTLLRDSARAASASGWSEGDVGIQKVWCHCLGDACRCTSFCSCVLTVCPSVCWRL